MIKKTAIALALVLTAACASTPGTQSASSGVAGIGGGIPTRAADAPNYVLLASDATLVREFDFTRRVHDFHVRGTMTNRGFYPAGDVQGNGQLCAEGQDWIEFQNMTVHKAGSGTPNAPYLLGCAQANGSFIPATRTISLQ